MTILPRVASIRASKVSRIFFDKFVDMMNNKTNSFIRTRGLRLIAYHAKWDNENKISSIIEQWLSHIEDEKPITARQCIQDVIVNLKNVDDYDIREYDAMTDGSVRRDTNGEIGVWAIGETSRLRTRSPVHILGDRVRKTD